MKKFKSFAVVFLAVLLSVMTLITGCGSGGLDVPFGIVVDQDNNLTWEAVEGARSYRIEIKFVDKGSTTESSTRKTMLSLSDLEEGNYEIRIMAIGGSSSSEITSPWSQTYSFEKKFESGILYELVGDEYHVKKAGTASGFVIIEDEYRDKPVTAIDDAAFRASSRITDLVIGNNVRTIGENAFYNCTSLQSVTLPNSLESIGQNAFQGCRKLESIALPGSLTQISSNAFAYCRALTDITFGEGVEYIGPSSFYECSALKQIKFPDSLTYIDKYAFHLNLALESVFFGSGIEYIGPYAFENDYALSEITFADLEGELSIDQYAFSSCNVLKEVDLPEGTVSIGDYAFYSSIGLERISIPDSVKEMGKAIIIETNLCTKQLEESGFAYADTWLSYVNLDTKKELTVLNESNLKEGTRGIANYVFTYANLLASVDLPASVKYIGQGAFYGSPVLYKLSSPENGLVKIDYSAFAYCAQLSRVNLNDGMEEIGSYAFYECTVLDNNDFAFDGTLIPTTVTKVGRGAFENTVLWSKPDEYGVIYAGDWIVGFNQYALKSTVVIDNAFGIADYAFYQATALQNISGVNNVEHLGRGAFYLCTHLGAVSLNRNLEVIQPYTFYKCAALYDIGDLPWNLKEIGDYAFYVCSTLKSLDLYDTQVTRIGSHAFYGCTNLSELYLGDTLETLDAYAFYRVGITELEIPDSVTTLGERAFGLCTSLASVTFGSGVEEIGEFAFRECTQLSEIALPDSVKKIGNYAFYGCESITSVRFGRELEYIGKYAFAKAARLVFIEFPASLDYIGASAFKGSGLKTVVMRGSVSYVGQYAFSGTSITVYTSGVVGGGWDAVWNERFRPVVQNCVFDETDGHLVSVTIEEDTILNGYVWGGIGAPEYEGYDFVGWATQQGSSLAEYGMGDLLRVPAGTTLYAVWAKSEGAEKDIDPSIPDEPCEEMLQVDVDLGKTTLLFEAPIDRGSFSDDEWDGLSPKMIELIREYFALLP